VGRAGFGVVGGLRVQLFAVGEDENDTAVSWRASIVSEWVGLAVRRNGESYE
jgi:hypothetical protein